MRFRVETTARAKQDLDDILIWLLARQAGDAGLRWFQGLRDAVASLNQSPGRCRLAPEDEVFPFEVRELRYGKKFDVYRILFTVEGDTVTILHIRHGRRAHLSSN